MIGKGARWRKKLNMLSDLAVCKNQKKSEERSAGTEDTWRFSQQITGWWWYRRSVMNHCAHKQQISGSTYRKQNIDWHNQVTLKTKLLLLIRLSLTVDHLYILNAVRCLYVRNAGLDQLSTEWRHTEHDLLMRTDGLVAGFERRRHQQREWRHNENDVINDNSWLSRWRYRLEIWWLATCGHGLQRCSDVNNHQYTVRYVGSVTQW